MQFQQVRRNTFTFENETFSFQQQQDTLFKGENRNWGKPEKYRPLSGSRL